MDAYDYEKIDKEMSRRVDAIYSDPTRHKFYSCHQAFIDNNFTGPRGGKRRGKKTICWYCGTKEKGHADKDEQL